MMECRQVKQLLPLWIGRDLPDSSSAAEIASHLGHCPDCNRQRSSLQQSLDVLQSCSSETFSSHASSSSVWPRLASRISEWEAASRRQARFNGWIPASVMALAVALMVTVSIPTLHDELFGDGTGDAIVAENLFQTEPQFNSLKPHDGSLKQPVRSAEHRVNYKHEQW